MKILTFDIEEWFHILDNKSTKSEIEWLGFESRIHRNMDLIYELKQKTDFSATFFIVGWIAKKYPNIVKKIDDLGFEIGSHSNMHQLVYDQSPEEFSEDVKSSISTIEDIIGKKIRSYRAPGFSITKNSKWAFEILCKNGITHDCSVFPASRSHGGFPHLKANKPLIIKYNGLKIKEFPINTKILFGKPIIFSGGGYFRLFPYHLIRNWTNQSDYLMTYFHPRDFDPYQPVIKDLSFFRRFKSYVGLDNCYKKLEKWIMEYDFMDLKTADLLVDWKKAEILEI